jgi:hypothetical protein
MSLLKRLSIIGLLGLNLMVYYQGSVPQTQAGIAESALKQINLKYLGKLSEDIAIPVLQKVVEKMRSAQLAEYALEQGMSLEEIQGLLGGQIGPSLIKAGDTALTVANRVESMKAQTVKQLKSINISLDNTVKAEAFNQYTNRIGDQMKEHYQQMVKEYQKQIQDLMDQVKDLYQKFPSAPINMCS